MKIPLCDVTINFSNLQYFWNVCLSNYRKNTFLFDKQIKSTWVCVFFIFFYGRPYLVANFSVHSAIDIVLMFSLLHGIGCSHTDLCSVHTCVRVCATNGCLFVCARVKWFERICWSTFHKFNWNELKWKIETYERIKSHHFW